jgi:hypothetical protein
VSFIIPVRNDARRLAACLSTIVTNDKPRTEVEVVVIDHTSTDDSPEVARAAGARVLSQSNGSVATLRNRGAAVAAGDILAFVDSDHTIDPAWARVAVDLLGDASVGAVGAPCRPPTEGSWVQRTYDGLRHHEDGSHDVTWLGSGNLAVRRELFLQLGGFSERLETCEDVDLCQRIRAHGYRIVSDSRLHSIHHGDPRTLRHLFRGELWRGRDNLRVSLRLPLALGELPSIVVPIVGLVSLVTLLVAAVTGSVLILLAALATFGALAAARAARICMRRRSFGFVTATQAMLVALVYDAARALAIVARTPHRRSVRGDVS